MSEKELNESIAEVCGWKRVRLGTQSRNDPEPRGWLTPESGGDWRFAVSDCPNFCRDLNAMHEAEKKLRGMIALHYYTVELCKSVGLEGEASGYEIARVAHATARQRAEAFLKATQKPTPNEIPRPE